MHKTCMHHRSFGIWSRDYNLCLGHYSRTGLHWYICRGHIIVELELTKHMVATLLMHITKHACTLASMSVESTARSCLLRYCMLVAVLYLVWGSSKNSSKNYALNLIKKNIVGISSWTGCWHFCCWSSVGCSLYSWGIFHLISKFIAY